MIIESTESIYEGVEVDQLTHTEQFWACGGAIGSNVIDVFTFEDKPISANSFARAKRGTRWGFGATSYAEMLAEIAIRGYEFPTQEENE